MVSALRTEQPAMTSVNLDSNVYAQQQDNEENWQRERETCLVWSV